MKKRVRIAAGLMFSLVTANSATACVNPFLDDKVLRITIVTDGHTISDKSFNESSYDGAKKFQAEFKKWVDNPNSSAPADLRKKEVEITAIQPTTVDLNKLLESYSQAVVMNSAVTIASGFIQDTALIAAQNGALKNKMRYIYVDGDTPNNVVSYQNKNLAGLLYQAEQSGLLAAIAAGVWLIAHKEQYGGDDNLKMSTYGGLDIPAVTNYMYGFYWGIELLNNSEKYSPQFTENLKSLIKILNPDFDLSQALPKIKFVDLPKENQFTGSFDQASNGSKALNGFLVEQNTNVIFPVAGPQTADTLAALKTKKHGKVIGVDTDQQSQYSESADYFLTSALKNITGSVSYMLWRALNYDETEEHKQLPIGEQDKIFKEDAVSYGGSNFVGIANNEAIKPIYDQVTSNSELTKADGFLEKVSQGWQKVLTTTKSNFWKIGKGINPFQ